MHVSIKSLSLTKILDLSLRVAFVWISSALESELVFLVLEENVFFFVTAIARRFFVVFFCVFFFRLGSF